MTLWDIYEKSEVFMNPEGGEAEKESASLFVCGMVLREIFWPGLQVLYPKTEYSTEQLWYLLCLYHDRRLEKRALWNLACQRSEICYLKKVGEAANIGNVTNWKPMGLLFAPPFLYGEKGVCFTGNVCVKESPLEEETIKDMFCFRSMCSIEGGMDHGIAGGLLLYENVICRKWLQTGSIKEEDVYLNAYLSNVLMVHHLLPDMQTVSSGPNPLLLLLWLAEAIEPFHYVEKDGKRKEVLCAIGVEIREKALVLRPDYQRFPAEQYIQKIMEAAEKTGMQCQRNKDIPEIMLHMHESPIIDELFN